MQVTELMAENKKKITASLEKLALLSREPLIGQMRTRDSVASTREDLGNRTPSSKHWFQLSSAFPIVANSRKKSPLLVVKMNWRIPHGSQIPFIYCLPSCPFVLHRKIKGSPGEA